MVEEVGGPEVLEVIEQDDPRPGPDEVCVKVLAAGVSFTDTLIRAGTYLGGPKPPFTPGYEIVGEVEETGDGVSELTPGDRVAALLVYGGYTERVCIPERKAVKIPADLDPADVVNLVFPYMTAYQLLHRTARAKSGDAVLVHGAAGRVGTATLELGTTMGLRLFGTSSARDREKVEQLGAVAIDYRNEDFVSRVREETGDGVDIALDGFGGWLSLGSFRALRPGGRLVIFGHSSTISEGRRSRRGWIEWFAATGLVGAMGFLWPRRKVLSYRIAKLADLHPDWFRDDLADLIRLLRAGKVNPEVAERLPLTEARHAHELLQSSASTGRLVLVP